MGRYADAVTQILLKQGDARAQGALGSGQAWGQAVQQLGQIPGQMIQQGQQLRNAQQEGEVRAQGIASAKALAAQREQEVTTAQELSTRSKALNTYIAELGDADPDPKKVVSIMGPQDGPKIASGFLSFRALQRGETEKRAEHVQNVMLGLQALPDEQRARAYPGIRETLIAGGDMTPDQAPPEYDPVWWQTRVDYGKAQAKPAPVGTHEIRTRRADGSEEVRLVPNTPSDTVYTSAPPVKAKPAVGSFEDYVVREFGDNPTTAQITTARKTYQQADDRPRITVNAGGGEPDDVKQIVQGMMDGSLPPQLPGRASPSYNSILAEAKRRGFNLSQAVTDWQATTKSLQTMNGAQQVRLRQAIGAMPDMLDKVDDLAKQWDAGGFPALNRAQLALAKGGAFGPKAATIATALDAQIADVVADLGNIYMGGNSPTDHALGLAGKSLQADWSAPVLRSMVKLAKENVTIRRNSINNTGVQGASADNPYMAGPPAAPVPPPVVAAPAPGGPPAVAAAKVGDVVTVQGKRVKITALHPDGTFDGQAVP